MAHAQRRPIEWTRRGVRVKLEEGPYLFIYWTRWNLLDWRVQHPETMRFMYKPKRVFFVCSKKTQTRGKKKAETDIEIQYVCTIENSDLDSLSVRYGRRFVTHLLELCMTCHLSGCYTFDEYIEYLELAKWKEVGASFTLTPTVSYATVEDKWHVGTYHVSTESCLDCLVKLGIVGGESD